MRRGWALGLTRLFGSRREQRRRARHARRRERSFRRLAVERLEDRSLLAATLLGTVWQDLNSDGQQSGGEPAVEYAVAELFSSTNGTIGDADDVSLGTRITDSAGNYQFTGLVAGVNHFVVIRPPVGFAFTTQDTGPDATDSDVSATGVSAMFAPVDLSTVDLDAGLTGAAPTFGWAARQGGTGGDEGRAVAVDAAGYSVVAGRFQGTVDFDSGPGTYNLTSAGGIDIYVAKFTPGGALVWARNVGGTSTDVGYGVAVDSGGNVLVTGSFRDTADFDPGAGVANLTSAGSDDVFILKLDAVGNYVWASRVGGTFADVSYGVAVDTSGNVLVTGYFLGTADFDPGVGVADLTSAGGNDAFVLKLDGAGLYQWAGRVGGTSGDIGYGVAVDTGGNVLVTGYFNGTADFDPGAGVADLTSANGTDAFVLKLDGAGLYQWAGRVGGTSGDIGYGVAVDSAGNVLVTGEFQGMADFDPGPGVANLTSAGGNDAFVLKLDGAGLYQWAGRVGGTSSDSGYGVAVDATGNVLVTGYLGGTADFDPGAGVANLTSAGNLDAFVLKLDAAGNYVWAGRAGGTTADIGYGVAVDGAGNFLVTGSFEGTADFDPSAGALNLTSAGGLDGFVWRLEASQLAPEINLVGNGQSIASGDSTPSLGDYTDFSAALVAGGTRARTFTIQNLGPAALTLTGTPLVQISGGHAADFTVALQPAGSLNEGQSTSFQITFDPSGLGLRSATVTIQNNDADEGSYTFAIQGLGSEPATVQGTVWHDLDSDGQQTGGEQGVQYAVVELFDTVDGVAGSADDLSLGVRVTDASGSYQFTGVAAGASYYIVVRPPAGFAFTVQDTGPDATDSDVSATTGRSAMFAPVDLATVDLDAGLTGGTPTFGWAAAPVGIASAVTVDASGNSHVTGSFSGTADFDSGPGTYSLTSVGQADAFVAKFTAGGALVWARRIGNSGNDYSYGIGVDGAGNVVVAGEFTGTGDFDPGEGVANLTSAGGTDVFVLKLDAAGNYQWARRVGGLSSEYVEDVALDSDGNVLVMGYFDFTADFDPGPGVANLTVAGRTDVFVLKLDATGNYQWAGRVGGTEIDKGYGLAVDSGGNVLVTGEFTGTADFDPGPGVANLASAFAFTQDVFVLKLNAAGSYVWAGRVGGSGSDFGYGVAVDSGGNVLVTGSFGDTADFDPGAVVANLTTAGSSDAFVLKLDAAGNYQWAGRIGGMDDDRGSGVAVDSGGKVFVTGAFRGTADFDPGTGVVNLTSVGGDNAFVLNLDAGGNYRRARIVRSPSPRDVAVDTGGNVIVTGPFSGTVDFDPGAGVFNLTGVGLGNDGFLWRLNATNFLPPTVTGVFVRGTGDGSGTGNDEWQAVYLGHLGTQGLGDSALGYRVSVGADQLDTLPWTNVDTVSIRFSEGVTVTSGNLQVLGAAEGPAVPSVASFSYNASTFTATWQFATALPANKYLLHFATGVVVGLDSLALDGEWADGVSTASGNGAAGGAFSFRMNVVPGDVNGDAATTQSVTNADVLLTKQALSTDVSLAAAYLYRRDVNGSGAITNADVLQAKQRLSTSIFDFTEPVPPPPGESSGEESFAAGTLLDEPAGAPIARLTEPWHTAPGSTNAALAEPVAPGSADTALLDEPAVAPSSADTALLDKPAVAPDLEAWDAAILAIYGKKK